MAGEDGRGQVGGRLKSEMDAGRQAGDGKDIMDAANYHVSTSKYTSGPPEAKTKRERSPSAGPLIAVFCCLIVSERLEVS